MAEIISKNISIGPCQVHILHAEKPEGHSVLLLHGARFQAATWKDLRTLEQLSDAGYRAYAIDLPGFGRSPSCNMGHVDLLKTLIREENPARPVLVGPSMGGKICLDFVLKQPDLVGGLVLIGAVGVRERSKQLHSIQVPCLVVWGSRDPIAPIEAARILIAKITGSELKVFENAGHPCYLDEPDLWHKGLLAFLDKNFQA